MSAFPPDYYEQNEQPDSETAPQPFKEPVNMVKTFGVPAYELAQAWMAEHRDLFPVVDHAALTDQLASDIQSALEDFFEYPDITMKHLRRMQELRRDDD